jgi:predicted  nucleic acid-binding Zn-ribbon protein
MKKTAILTVTFSILVATSFLNGYADDLAAQINGLEQKASRIQTQIEQATKQSEAALEPQVKQLQASIENLIQQRVRIDSQIASLEQKIQSLQSTAQAGLTSQVQRYDKELADVRQELAGLAGLVAKQATRAMQKPDNVAKPLAPTPPTPAQLVPAAPVR